MEAEVHVLHYAPVGVINVSITFYKEGVLTEKKVKCRRQFCLDLKKAKREREADLLQLLSDIEETGYCNGMQSWVIHKIDQMTAYQREWNKGNNYD